MTPSLRLPTLLSGGQLLLAAFVGTSFLVPMLPETRRDDFIQFAYLVIGAPTLWVLWTASSESSREAGGRSAWRDLALSVGLWWIGDVLGTALVMAGSNHALLQLLTDLCYLGSYPLGMRAMTHFSDLGATRAARLRVQLDVVVACFTAATLFYWFSPLEVVDGGTLSWTRDLLNLTYPIGDGMLLTSTLLLASRQKDPASQRVVRLLAVGFACRAVANLLFARPLVADARLFSLATDTAWFAWYGIVSWSAAVGQQLRATSPVESRSTSDRVEWLPWLCVSILSAVLVYLVLTDRFVQARGVSVGMFSLLVTVVFRQLVMNRERRDLDRVVMGRDAEQRLAALVRHSSELIMVIDPAGGVVRFVSASLDRILGAPPSRCRTGRWRRWHMRTTWRPSTRCSPGSAAHRARRHD